ncbi:MAG: response regulator [Methylococcales bacterium]|nr:response regulator [Methylococcales bacterium]MCK5926308.1 response regulator [Methylococcales bacterium]
MTSFYNSPIDIKIKRLILTTLGLALFFMVIALSIANSYLNKKHLTQNIKVQANIIIATAKQSIYSDDSRRINELIQSFKDSPKVEYALISVEGDSNYALYKGELPNIFMFDFLPSSEIIKIPFSYAQTNLHGVELQPAMIRQGRMKVKVNFNLFYQEQLQDLALIISIAFLFLIITLLSARKFIPQMLYPIIALDKTIKKALENPQKLTQATIYNKDVIGNLTESFNTLFSHIYLNQKSLESQLQQGSFELEQALLNAQEANQARSDFVTNISHEIRTPMNAIINMNRFALKTNLTDTQRNYLTTIETSASWLLNVINDTLDFSRIESGNLQLDQAEFTLADFLQQLEIFADKAHGKGLELIFKYPLSLDGYFVFDDIRLSQVLMNLISNAIKFTEKGQVVIAIERIEALDKEATLLFSVSDTGVGVDEKYGENLFNSFSQADMSITRKYGGTGLGLAISQKLVHLMGGHIQFESQLNQGSRFYFSLTLMKSMREPLNRLACYQKSIEHLKVFVLDTHDIYQTIFKSYFDELNISLTTLSTLSVIKKCSSNEIVFINWDCLNSKDRVLFSQKTADELSAIILMATASEREKIIASHPLMRSENILNKPLNIVNLMDSMSFRLHHKPYFEPIVVNVSEREQLSKKMQAAHILLVEDNLINQRVARELLERKGIKVTIANNGKEAIDILSKHTFDLVLMDVQMPVMDGYQASIEIRKYLTKKTLPIVALTAHAMQEDKERCLSVEMNDYLAKPINPELLYSTLGKYLGNVKLSQPIKQTIVIKKKTVDTFPKIAGIDFQEGLLRLRENRKLYMKLLEMFIQEHKDSFDEIKQKIKDSDFKGATMKAHTLKGVGANLGAKALSNVAGELETQLKKKNQRGIESKLLVLTDEIERFIEGIGRIPPHENQS